MKDIFFRTRGSQFESYRQGLLKTRDRALTTVNTKTTFIVKRLNVTRISIQVSQN